MPTVLDTLRIPVLASPMFLVSGPELVIAQSTAGIIGSFPSLNARPQEQLGDWLAQIEESLAAHDAAHPAVPSAPFAVNLIVHRSNDRLDRDLATIVEHRVPVVITSLGARPEVNAAVHSYGGMILHDVVSDRFARKAVEKGADGLIAVAAGAGGHAGTLSPFALVQEIRAWFDGPLVLSGALAHGRSILAALAAGADLAYVGSAFIATDEARAVPEYKQMIVESNSADIVYTSHFSGVSANYLGGSIIAAGLDPNHLIDSDSSAMDFGSNGEEGKLGPRPWRDIWGAGQGIATTTRVVPARELVDRFAREFVQAQQRLAGRAGSGWRGWGLQASAASR